MELEGVRMITEDVFVTAARLWLTLFIPLCLVSVYLIVEASKMTGERFGLFSLLSAVFLAAGSLSVGATGWVLMATFWFSDVALVVLAAAAFLVAGIFVKSEQKK
jgi:hypothetical protein